MEVQASTEKQINRFESVDFFKGIESVGIQAEDIRDIQRRV